MTNYFNFDPVVMPGKFSTVNLQTGATSLTNGDEQKAKSVYTTNAMLIIYPSVFSACRMLASNDGTLSIATGKNDVIVENNAEKKVVRVVRKKTKTKDIYTVYGATVLVSKTKDASGKEVFAYSYNVASENDLRKEITTALVAAFIRDNKEFKEAFVNCQAEFGTDENNNAIVLAPFQNRLLIALSKMSTNISGRIVSDILEISDIKPFDKSKSNVSVTDITGNFEFFDLLQNTEIPTLDFDVDWTKEEQSMIPVIDKTYAIPQYVKEDAMWIKETSDEEHPFRNVYYYGPAGTGKTSAVKAICSLLNIPYGKTTCSPDTEIFDFLGQVFPTTGGAAITADDIIREKKLPTVDDIMIDTASSYKLLTGKEMPKTTDQSEVITRLMERVVSEMTALSSNEKEFTYVESGLLKAVQNGYGHEIQEPTVIQRAVLVGLNGLLDPADGNAFQLPNGKLVKKHKNCCIFFTSNADYEGCKILNQSVLDRCDIVREIENPTDSEIKARIRAKTGFDDDVLLGRMLNVMKKINVDMSENDITDGIFGLRSLQNWAIAMKVKARRNGVKLSELRDEEIHECAELTVLDKLSQNKADKECLVTVFDTQFASL